MKKIIFFPVILFFVIKVCANDTTFVWPVKGNPAGLNILYKPNDYLADEQLFSDLIIATHLEDTIISPVDGIITSFHFTYKHSLSSGIAYDPAYYFDKKADSILNNNRKSEIQDSKYFTATIALLNKDGRKIYLTGFIPYRWFKTGEKLRKGDILGNASYAYHKIPEPCLFISISRNAIPDDPMTPFGLKTSFKAAKKNNKVTISEAEMLEDMAVLETSLREGHPGLFDYLSESEFQLEIVRLKQKTSVITAVQEFKKQIDGFLRLIRDSHLSVINTEQMVIPPFTTWPAVSFGFLNDSLIIDRAAAEFTDYLGRRISQVNGFEPDTIKQVIKRTIGEHDGYVESYPDFVLLTLTSIRFFREFFPSEESRDLVIRFYDGETVEFKGEKHPSNSCIKYYPSIREYYIYPKEKFFTKMISDSVAHIALGTFDLNDIEMIEIQDFIHSLNTKDCTILIIDLRNNYGGNSENLNTLFDLISPHSFSEGDQMVVTSNTGYSFFQYTDNYGMNDTLFKDYCSIDGKSGYFLDTKLIEKKYSDDQTFKGNVFVLVNERSFSAAAVFAGLVKKYKRGLIIGRETGSTYYQINASRFANLMLPNSMINVQIPLVKIVFDSVIRPGIPWGRGVMPDYYIDFTLDELAWKHDTILNAAISFAGLPYNAFDNQMDETESLLSEEGAPQFSFSRNQKHLGIALISLIVLSLIYVKLRKKT